MRKIIAVLLVGLMLGACASTSRAMSFGNRFADARFSAAGQTFSLWVHPTEDVIMLQSTWGNAAAVGAVEGATFGAASIAARYETWLSGAQAFVAPLECEVQNLRPLDQDIMWEFDYRCPEGIDLRALVSAQREALRAGAPLHR